jgi:ABC-type lipoprotein release transport system permease subunit
MWLLIKLGARNLRRHLRRTLITSSAIAFGLFFLIVGATMGDGQYRDTVKNAVRLMSGHVVVQGEGWQKKQEADILVKDGAAVAEKLRQAFPTAAVARRVFLNGLLTSPEGAMGVGLNAVVPSEEEHISEIKKRLIEGRYVGEDKADILIGATLAETLGVQLGDKVVFMVQSKGVVESQLFRVCGLFKTGADEMDGFFGVIHLAAAQKLLHLGDAVTQVAVILDQDQPLDEMKASAVSAVGTEGLEVLTWKESMPEVWDYIILDRWSMYIMVGLIGLIALVGVLNTILMSVLERVREFGTMLALGMSQRRLAALVLVESILLGIVATIIGAGLGVAAGLYLANTGIDYSAIVGGDTMTVAGVPVETMLYGYVSWSKIFAFSGLTVLVTIISGLYPVWWASRLTPVKAMAHR